MAVISDFVIYVMSTGGRELDAGTGFCGISDTVQLLDLGQRIGYSEIHKVSFKAGII